VITARAKHPGPPERRDLDQERVAAGYQERHVREGRRIGLEERGEQMSLEMMHADGGDAPRVGETPRERGTGQERPDEPGAGGVGDPVEVPRGASRALTTTAKRRQQAPA